MAALAVAGAIGGCGGAPRPALHRIEIRSFRFEPAKLSLVPGDTAEWINRDILPHTATARGKQWDSGSLAPGAAWRTVMRAPGTEAYLCLFHPTMAGTLEVR